MPLSNLGKLLLKSDLSPDSKMNYATGIYAKRTSTNNSMDAFEPNGHAADLNKWHASCGSKGPIAT
jgi:hypothetical protein